MTRKYLTALLIGLGSFVTASAQLSGSVSVEGEYQPIVIETERLNAFPQGYRFELPAPNVQYEYTGIVTDYQPGLYSMGVTGRQTEFTGRKPRGFVDFRLGSYLNSRLHAGYWIVTDSVNTLSADLKFNSSTLYRTHGVPDTYARPARKRYYEGALGLDYTRIIGGTGMLDAHAGYRTGYFNYFGTTAENAMLAYPQTWVPAPSQSFNQIDASIGYRSTSSIIEGWHAGTSIDYFAYRRLYSPDYSDFPEGHYGFNSQRGDHETRLRLGGGYAFPFADWSALAIDADMDFLFYSKKKPEVLGLYDYPRNNYGVITFTPAYRFEQEGLSIHAGADLAISYNAMGRERGKHFGGFHVAPNVALRYGSKAGVGMFLTATGGVTPSTLILRGQFDRYQMPWLLSTQPIYTPFDFRLGLNFGPFAGFTGEVAFRYAAAKNVPLGGWYQAYLGTYPFGDYSLEEAFYCDPWMQSVNLHGYSLDLDLNYKYGTLVEVGFNTRYTHQKGKKGIFNGFDRPRWILEANVGCRPIKRLKVDLAYDYRGVRNCYYRTATEEGIQLAACRLKDISDLNLKVTYSLLDNLDIYCRADNLINRRVDILPGLQSEGIVISGGFYWEF